jgi:integrase
MRIQEEKQSKVWLTTDDVDRLRRVAASRRDELIIDLGARVGLRAFEIPQVTPSGVKRTSDGRHYRIHVPEGKDTKHGDGKPRDAYLPESLERRLHSFARDEDLDDDEPYVDLSTRGVRAVVKRTAEAAAEAYGNEDWRKVSSHDLRRHFAQRLLVDEDMNPRVVMDVGGWNSFQAIEPYLNTPTERVINEAFEEVNL